MADTEIAEIWLPVKGYEGFYEVSSLGQVRSLDKVLELSPLDPRSSRFRKGRILSQYSGILGRKSLGLSRDGVSKTHLVHRLVCIAFHGNAPDEYHEVAHRNGDASDNRAENLRWLTSLENNREQYIHGTRTRGTMVKKAKLNEEKVREIRRLSISGKQNLEIAKIIGICPSNVCRVISRQTWGWVE